MRRSLFLLIIPLLAVASASAQVPPPTQKLLLVGHWQDATDPSAIIDVVEEYSAMLPAKDGAEVPLVISSHSCGGTTLGGRKISTKPNGSW